MSKTKNSTIKKIETVSSESISLDEYNKRANRANILHVIFIIFLIVGVGTRFYLHMVNAELNNKYNELNDRYEKLLADPEQAALEEIRILVERVGALITLPADEVPQIATVLDKDALKDQAFFLNSENGDKVLIYSKAMKAVLYRPSTNKIIEVSPLILEDGQDINPGLSTHTEDNIITPEYSEE
jgi:hypothetical protein